MDDGFEEALPLFATETERHAHDVLRREGFSVQAIPRGATKTADFLVSDAASTYLIEVTGRDEDEFLAKMAALARIDGVADGSRPIAPDRPLGNRLFKKAHQLQQTPVPADFRVLWLAAFHQDHDHICRLLARTLYGTAKLFAVASGKPDSVRECMYYHPSAFGRLPDLDAVVFATRAEGYLFVNGLSPRATALRATKLYSMFGRNSRRDPAELPTGVLVVPPDLDRSQTLAAWQFLKDHHGVMTSEAQEVNWHGIVALDRDENDA